MKLLPLIALLIASTLFTAGCATPAYSARERDQMIARNWDFERKQIIDDFDSIMLLRPASRMTIWNIR